METGVRSLDRLCSRPEWCGRWAGLVCWMDAAAPGLAATGRRGRGAWNWRSHLCRGRGGLGNNIKRTIGGVGEWRTKGWTHHGRIPKYEVWKPVHRPTPQDPAGSRPTESSNDLPSMISGRAGQHRHSLMPSESAVRDCVRVANDDQHVGPLAGSACSAAVAGPSAEPPFNR